MQNTPYTEALSLAQQGQALVLTGNNRLSRHLQELVAAEQQAAGASVWQAPNVQVFGHWLAQLWEHHLGGVLLGWQHPQAGWGVLTEAQSQALWLAPIKADAASVLMNKPAAAETALAAWQLLQQWQVQEREWPAYGSADMAAFAQWRQAVEQRMQVQQWLDESQLPSLLATMVQDVTVPLPKQIFTLGLQRLTPAEQALLNAMEAQGCSIVHLPLPSLTGRAECFPAASPADEFLQAAQWARQQLETTVETAPEASHRKIGIVLLNGAQQQLPMRDALLKTLHPDRQWSTPETDLPLAFNLSMGDSLSRQPIVQSALTLLQWLQQPLSVETAAALIQSPWLAGAGQEQEARAQLARRVLENDQPQCGREWALKMVAQYELPCLSLVQQLDAAAEAWQRAKEQQHETAAQWLPAISGVLSAAGWAQPRADDCQLDSQNWQAAQRFKELLEEVVQLDLVTSRFSARDAIQSVRQRCESTVFQPQGSNAPVQVMGPLEAIGQQFDALWVLGANDETLPAAVRPSPYLPKDWQRDLCMPKANAAQEQQWAQQTVAQLSQSAPQVVFSYCQADGETPFRPAAALKTWPAYVAKQTAEPLAWLATAEPTAESAADRLESLEDAKAEALPGSHPVQAPGGSRLFADQASCAFKAFAHWRLHAQAIELPEWGMDARELGNCLHRALEIFWNKHGSHTALCALEEAQQGLEVRAAIATASQWQRSGLQPALADAMQSLEQAVLHPLIMEWLNLERERESFTVQANEEKLQVSVGRLRLSMTVDRIDRLNDDSQVIIDYKTSRKLDIKAWNPPRPEQPQLPLYAVQLTENETPLAAVMFAQLAPGSVQPVGLAKFETVMAGLELGDEAATAEGDNYQPNLKELLPLWKKELTRLAENFAAGDAAVSPKNPDSCKFCDLQPLCRVDFDDAAATTVTELAS